jgi:hypothetical protein
MDFKLQISDHKTQIPQLLNSRLLNFPMSLVEVRNLTKVYPLGESVFGGGSHGEVARSTMFRYDRGRRDLWDW